MWTELVKYVPMLEVELYDGRKYYVPVDKKAEFRDEWKKNGIITIGESMIAAWAIKTVEPAFREVNRVESCMMEEPEEIKREVRRIVEKRKLENKPCEPGNIRNIIEKLKEDS